MHMRQTQRKALKIIPHAKNQNHNRIVSDVSTQECLPYETNGKKLEKELFPIRNTLFAEDCRTYIGARSSLKLEDDLILIFSTQVCL